MPSGIDFSTDKWVWIRINERYRTIDFILTSFLRNTNLSVIETSWLDQ